MSSQGFRGTTVILLAGFAAACAAMARAADLDSLKQNYVKQQYGMFVCYNMSTYTGKEWAYSYDTDAAVAKFKPTGYVDTDQWAAVAKNAGMTYGVLTAKHTDGFCLWDTAISDYDVASCPWFNDSKNVNHKRDVVKAYTDSFRKAGLGVGIYYSIWDKRNGIGPKFSPKDVAAPQLSSTAATEYVKAQLKELLTNYGRIDVIWFDGWGMGKPAWNGYTGAGDGTTTYAGIEYAVIRDYVHSLSPGTVIVNNSGKGNPSLTDIMPYETTLPEGRDRLPCEACDVIRADKKWFWHPAGAGALRDAKVLGNRKLYVNACNGTYLLDVPPDRSGVIPAAEVNALKNIKEYLDGLKSGDSTAPNTTMQERTEK